MIIDFTEAELTALYKFFERGIANDLSPMEVVQVCVRGQLLVQSYAAKDRKTLQLDGGKNAAEDRKH
jgi:hypothetical protein